MIVAIVVVVVLSFIALMVVGYIINNVTERPKVMSYEEVYNKFEELGYDIPGFDAYDFEDVKISSEYGYQLAGKWLPYQNSEKSVIIVHGFTGSMATSMRYVDMFFSKGHNVLMYDHRCHGYSGGENCTMGYLEKYDLKTCITWVEEKAGKGTLIGLHGESMGAATSIMTAAIDKRISFVISDCSFANFYDEAKFRLKAAYKLPEIPFLYFIDFWNKIRFKHSYKDISPIDDLSKVNVPILFLHGDKDNVTPAEDSVKLYEAYNGKKELYIAENTGHVGTIHKHKQKYYQLVYELICKL